MVTTHNLQREVPHFETSGAFITANTNVVIFCKEKWKFMQKCVQIPKIYFFILFYQQVSDLK